VYQYQNLSSSVRHPRDSLWQMELFFNLWEYLPISLKSCDDLLSLEPLTPAVCTAVDVLLYT